MMMSIKQCINLKDNLETVADFQMMSIKHIAPVFQMMMSIKHITPVFQIKNVLLYSD